MRIFTSTKNTYNENKKAEVKNYNLPTLRFMYMGSMNKELKCSISGEDGFVDVWSFVRKKHIQHFNLEYNHIRQKARDTRGAGTSVDKIGSPSHIVRTYKLDEPKNRRYLIEMMCCMPLTTAQHTFVSRDSAYQDIVLSTFPKKYWPWHLRNKNNFNKFCNRYELDLDYYKFIGMLDDIHAPSIPDTYGQKVTRKHRLIQEHHIASLFVPA